MVLAGCTQQAPDKPIQSDPLLITGQMDNGLQYHIYPSTKEPVSIRMFVHIGSAHEDESQKGYAHFLEHMAFNGSKNFTSNDVVSLFEQSGMTFGADINAYTSYYETVYKLDLPDNQQLDKGLQWMRDIADGLTLDPNEIEKEKGVIQGEIRRTRPENKSLSEKYYEHVIKGTELETLDPVGNKTSVAEATSQTIRAFYEKWYQPRYTEVIVTGDVTQSKAEELIAKHFGNWENDTDLADNKVAMVALNTPDFVEEIGEYDSPSLSLLIERGSASVKTRNQLLDEWLDGIAESVIWTRLDTRFNTEAQPLQSLYASSYYINYRRYGLLSVGFVEADREKAQRIFIDTLASLRDHGVTQQELDAATAHYQQLAKTVDEQWEQHTSVDNAESIVYAISLRNPLQSKEDYQQSLDAVLEQATLDNINERLRSYLSKDYAMILGAENQQAITPLTNQISVLRDDIKQVGVKPIALVATATELMKPNGSAQIVSEETLDNGFIVWTLENGVEVWYERDEKAGNYVNVVYGSQGGKAALDPSLFAASELAIPTISRSGLGDFNGPELDSYLQRNSIEVYPFINFTHHGVELTAPKDKLADTLNVIFNISTHVNVSEKQLNASAREVISNIDNYLATPVGKWSQAMNRNSYKKNSMHYMLPTPEYTLVTTEQVKEVHHQLFSYDRGNKLVVVGDIEPAELKEMVGYYIAGIPLTPAEKVSFDAGYKEPPKKRIDMAIYNEPNSYYILRVTNANTSSTTARTAFIDDMVQRLINKRLTSYVREELGLDYAPDNYATGQDQQPSTDWFIEAQVAPEDIKKIEQAIDKVIADVRSNVTQQDIDLVAKQLAVALHPLADDTGQRAWFYTRYLIHGYGVDALLDVDAMTQSITKEEFTQRVEQAFGDNSISMKYALTPES